MITFGISHRMSDRDAINWTEPAWDLYDLVEAAQSPQYYSPIVAQRPTLETISDEDMELIMTERAIACRGKQPQVFTCLRCGKEFQKAGRFRKYCSEECRKRVFVKRCVSCGTYFYVRSETSKKTTCSDECLLERRNAWREEVAEAIDTGDEF